VRIRAPPLAARSRSSRQPAAGSSDCTTSTSQFSGSWVVLGFPCWSLIARVGDNPPFFVGNGGTFTVPSGRLFLGVDDETLFFGDNSGSWVVAVQSAAPPPSDADVQRVIEGVLFWLTLPWDSLTQDQRSCLLANGDACLRDPGIKAIVGLGDINAWKKVLTDELSVLAGAFTQEQRDCLSGNATASPIPVWPYKRENGEMKMRVRSRLAMLAVAGATVGGLALAPGIAAAAAPPALPPGGVWNCLGGVPGQNDCQSPPPQQPSGAQEARHVECSDHLNAPWVAIYQDINFGGQCDAYEGPGNVVLPSGVADTASSINVGANGHFVDSQGASLPIQYGLRMADLRTIGWNDRVREIQIDN